MKVKSSIKGILYSLFIMLGASALIAEPIHLPPQGEQIRALLGSAKIAQAIQSNSKKSHESPKWLTVENDIRDFYNLAPLFQENQTVLDAVMDNSSFHINGHEIPHVQETSSSEAQSLLQKVATALKSIPVYKNKLTVDNKINWAAIVAMYLKRPIPQWIKSLLKALPTLHFTYKCSLDDTNFSENHLPASELVYGQPALHPIIKSPDLKTFVNYFVNYEKEWPRWGDLYIHLPQVNL
jgi:hypothetical protein